MKLGVRWRRGYHNPTSLARLMGIGRNRVYYLVRKESIGRRYSGRYMFNESETQRILESFREGRLYLRLTGAEDLDVPVVDV